MFYYYILVFGVLGLIVLKDIRDGIIPNILLLFLLLILIIVETSAIVMKTDFGSWGGIPEKLVETLLIAGILFPFFSIGALGAGDVKLILLIAFLTKSPLLFLAVVFAIAAVIALVKMFCTRKLRERIKIFFDYIKESLEMGYFPMYPMIDKSVISKNLSCIVHLSVPVMMAYMALFIGDLCN